MTTLSAKAIDECFKRLAAQNPHPTTELQYQTHFELLVAVMLSAQATDVSVNKATVNLFPVANTPEKIVDLGVDMLKTYIKSIGLYHTKAENVVKMASILLDKHQGQVPNTREDLEALPGVGRKTANVVLNTAFGQPTMAVDTHIFRVAHRLHLSQGKTPLAVEQDLLKRIPQKYQHDAHHWLILHGRYTCVARKPKCQTCLLADLCPSAGMC